VSVRGALVKMEKSEKKALIKLHQSKRKGRGAKNTEKEERV